MNYQSKYTPNCSCIVCGNKFYCPPSRKAIGRGKFCSTKCMGEFKKGKPDPNLTHKFPKGNKPWNTGLGNWREIECPTCNKKFQALESQGTVYCSKKCSYVALRIANETDMSYGTVHARVREMFGTPDECEHCGTTDSPKFEWANISGEYKLERSDWARLCCKCHRRFDFGVKNKIHKIHHNDNSILR